MNCRHVAALALVGWYLFLPMPGPGRDVDTTLPLYYVVSSKARLQIESRLRERQAGPHQLTARRIRPQKNARSLKVKKPDSVSEMMIRASSPSPNDATSHFKRRHSRADRVK